MRRLMMKVSAGGGVLPAEYQAVEWIESSGSQYINTNINQEDLGFEVKFISFDELSDSNYGAVMGARYASNSSDFELNSYTSTSHPTWSGTFKYGGSSQNYNAHFNPKGEINVISYLNGTYNANGTDYSYPSGTIGNTRLVYLFAMRSNTSASGQGKVRMYYCKLYKSGVLSADYVPCYRKADGVIGLYNMVNGEFKTNAGSGTFTKGGDV